MTLPLESAVTRVSDSLGTTYHSTPQAHANAGATLDAVIHEATLSSSGSDTISVTTNEVNYQIGVYVYEVSGVTTTGATGAIGTHPFFPANVRVRFPTMRSGARSLGLGKRLRRASGC